MANKKQRSKQAHAAKKRGAGSFNFGANIKLGPRGGKGGGKSNAWRSYTGQ